MFWQTQYVQQVAHLTLLTRVRDWRIPPWQRQGVESLHATYAENQKIHFGLEWKACLLLQGRQGHREANTDLSCGKQDFIHGSKEAVEEKTPGCSSPLTVVEGAHLTVEKRWSRVTCVFMRSWVIYLSLFPYQDLFSMNYLIKSQTERRRQYRKCQILSVETQAW